MSTEHVVHALECPNGHHPLSEPQIIGCKHILCRSCTEHATKQEEIQCPVNDCQKVSRRTEVQSMVVLREFLASQSVAGAYYPRHPTHIGPKAMEEDLLDDPDMEHWAARGTFPYRREDCDSDDSEDHVPRQQLDDVEMSQEPPKRIFEYAPNSKGERADEIEKDKTWDISAVLDLFYEATQDIEPIIAFYESFEGDKIYVDVLQGAKKEVETFFEKNFPKEWEEKRIIVVEQENDAEFFINTGDKIAAAQVADQPVPEVSVHIGQHPDRLDSYGTVTCLGESDTKEQYALTAKHILSVENRPQSETGCYVSSFNSQLTRISQRFMGILGGFQANGRLKQVDIAALPIEENILEKFDDRLVHSLNDVYQESDDRLVGVYVTKRGASSNYTSGEIIQVNYHLKKSRLVTGSHFLIAPSEKHRDFCVKGDSGALVWSTTGVPIGIVSRGFKNFYFEGRKMNVTLAVRLDDCLNALRQEMNVNIVKCKAYGAQLPYAPDPTNMNVMDTRQA